VGHLGRRATDVLTGLVLLAAAVLVAGPRLAAAAKEPDAPARAEQEAAEAEKALSYVVVAVAPVLSSFKQVVYGHGAIRADARGAHSISMATVGVVRLIEVPPGERVQQGQPLFKVEPDPLAYLACQQAVSAAKLARAKVVRLAARRPVRDRHPAGERP
jgi:multidrug efflux pump subunit AcrA (membrane-fusion protein)